MIRYTNIGYASSSTNDGGFYRRPGYIGQRTRDREIEMQDALYMTILNSQIYQNFWHYFKYQ